jgi:hypothetical protein
MRHRQTTYAKSANIILPSITEHCWRNGLTPHEAAPGVEYPGHRPLGVDIRIPHTNLSQELPPELERISSRFSS